MHSYILIECYCPEHGLERFKIKIIKKYNVNPKLIMPKFRSRPTHELSGLIVGRSVSRSEVLDFLTEYFNQNRMLEKIIAMRMRF